MTTRYKSFFLTEIKARKKTVISADVKIQNPLKGIFEAPQKLEKKFITEAIYASKFSLG